ncbi:chalcone synthase-like [Amborella trichopoda]|uniref:chalcone synthase-like n=1 Tax=Amborella trichopoda TaxID=13333 RepID=UPI0009BF9FEB|nr:chalcone synthase-like [Amborella trichopoda]|eukprot:XP_020532038.1 chalcone synthase-like [Amborella trichopoda]
MVNVEEHRKAQRADGAATVLAIGTANPPPSPQCDILICFLSSKLLRFTLWILGLDPNEVKPGAVASVDSIPLGLLRSTPATFDASGFSGADIYPLYGSNNACSGPGIDLHLKLLNLSPFVNRVMIYMQGCFAGGTTLRSAKDLAENNCGACVLIVCPEMMSMYFHGPIRMDPESLVVPALFGDGAATVVIGADPMSTERGLNQLFRACQSIVPNSMHALKGPIHEAGITYWNTLFYVVHPGGPRILDKMEDDLKLKPEKLRAACHVLREYENMWSATMFVVLDEIQKSS